MRRLEPESLGQHVDALYRAAWALCGSPHDAEDLVQETFVRVLARPRLIRGDERGYLLRALRNTFYTRLRTAARRPRTAATLDDISEPADARTATHPERALEVGELLSAISELPEDFRMAIVAIDILGLGYEEAARALNAREATIATRLFRARRRIVRRLSDDTPPPPAVRHDEKDGSVR